MDKFEFLVCSTDSEIFDKIIGYVPVLGHHEWFTIIDEDLVSLPDELKDHICIETA